MTHYCTLFDSNYLTRGLALYDSLCRQSKDFHLYILAFNQRALEILQGLNLPHTSILSLQEFEDPELLEVKPGRSIAEYSWTCSSSLIFYCLKRFHLPSCTYLDADIFFFNDPQVLIDELGTSSISLTEHRYTPENDRTETSGRFCVQFMTFKDTDEGFSALRWWRERCLEWCFARLEDGKMGDQKYLDDWPSRFPGVHILRHLGAGLAPWNIQQYSVQCSNPLLMRENSSGLTFPPVFYHFHQMRIYPQDTADLGAYRLKSEDLENFYRPYLRVLKQWDDILQQKFGITAASESRPPAWEWRLPLRNLKRRLKGVYNVHSTQSLLELR